MEYFNLETSNLLDQNRRLSTRSIPFYIIFPSSQEKNPDHVIYYRVRDNKVHLTIGNREINYDMSLKDII